MRTHQPHGRIAVWMVACLSIAALAGIYWIAHEEDSDPSMPDATQEASTTIDRDIELRPTRNAEPTLHASTKGWGSRVDLTSLDRNNELGGIVVRRDGSSVAGAVVTLMPGDDLRTNARTTQTRTDRNGQFLLQLNGMPTAVIRVSAKGLAEILSGPFQAGSKQRVVLDDPITVEVLVVRWDEKPVQQAEVVLHVHRGSVKYELLRATTDTHGKITWKRLPPVLNATVSLVSLRPGWGHVPATRLSSNRRRRGRRTTRPKRTFIEIPKGQALTGTVRAEASNKPISNARIGIGPTMSAETISDEAGQFTLSAWSNKCKTPLTVRCKGYAPAHVEVGHQSHVDVTLRAGVTFTGRVVNGQGTPMEGARVSALGFRTGGTNALVSDATSTTVADGSFELNDLRHDMFHEVSATFPGCTRAKTRLVRAMDKSLLDAGTLQLTRAHALSGQFLTRQGVPLAGQFVMVLGTRRRGASARHDVTDTDGRFRLSGLPSGPMTVVLSTKTRGATSTERHPVTIEADRDTTEIVLTSSMFRTIRVKVVDDTGTPVPHAEVLLLDSKRKDVESTSADAQGVAEFVTGPLASLVQAKPRIPQTKEARQNTFAVHAPQALGIDNAEVRLVLRRAHVTRGQALQESGAPLANATISIVREGQTLRRVTTDMDGRFQVTIPQGMSVDLFLVGHSPLASRTGSSPKEPQDSTEAGKLLGVVSGSQDIKIQSKVKAFDQSLTIRVLSPDGEPMKRFSVSLNPRPSVRPLPTHTDRDGEIYFTELPATPTQIDTFFYALTTQPWCTPLLPRVVPDGQTVEIKLIRGNHIAGHVEDSKGTRLRGGQIFVWHNGTRLCNARVNADGDFIVSIRPEIKSNVELRYVSRGGGHRVASVTASPGSDDVTIRVP